MIICIAERNYEVINFSKGERGVTTQVLTQDCQRISSKPHSEIYINESFLARMLINKRIDSAPNC
jgi:hypothetical protein